MDTLREAPFGQIVRYLTKNKYFRYPEENSGFALPAGYGGNKGDSENTSTSDLGEKQNDSRAPARDAVLPAEKLERLPTNDLEQQPTRRVSHDPHSSLNLQRTNTLPYTNERLNVEATLSIQRTQSRPITPSKTSDGIILVDWYTTDDQANPQNWSAFKKAWVAAQICLYTFTVYASSSIYVPSVPQIRAQFGIEEFKASLPLALYVLGYGTGPLLFSPMSEIPIYGRNVPYVATFAIFVAIAAPTAVLNNFGVFVFFRFLQGFFGSPCLANGGTIPVHSPKARIDQ